MTPTAKAGLAGAAAIAIAIFALAFAVAPKSCEGGLEIYTWSGLAAIAVLFALPFATGLSPSLGKRFAWAFGFAFFGFGVWFGALLAANIQILCRLF